MNGPADPETRRHWRAERARLARRLHPDLGGDVNGYLHALAELDARFGLVGADRVTGRSTTWQRIRRQARRSGQRVASLRGRLRRARQERVT